MTTGTKVFLGILGAAAAGVVSCGADCWATMIPAPAYTMANRQMVPTQTCFRAFFILSHSLAASRPHWFIFAAFGGAAPFYTRGAREFP